MITVRNEFEVVPAFTNVAGCSIGSQTDRETTAEILRAVDTTTQMDTKQQWIDLATCNDDNTDLMYDIQTWASEVLDEHMPMPFGCRVTLQDNEWLVLPLTENMELFLEEGDVEQREEVPDDFIAGHVIIVNDHGNVSMLEWDPVKRKYIEIWAVV